MSIDKPSISPVAPAPLLTGIQKNTIQSGQAFNLNFLLDSLSPIIDKPVTQVSNIQDKTQLSSAGQLIANLLKVNDQLTEQQPYQASGVIVQTPKDVQAFAQALKSIITMTGLFYESHIAEVMTGRLAPGEVIQDPKNQQPELIPRITTQQLTILDDHKFVWQGQVWQGQHMDWSVHFLDHGLVGSDHKIEDEAEQNSSVNEATLFVVNEIKLTLPKLGLIDIKINIYQKQVSVNLYTDNVETQMFLDQSKQRLSDAMQDSGQNLSKLEVDLL